MEKILKELDLEIENYKHKISNVPKISSAYDIKLYGDVYDKPHWDINWCNQYGIYVFYGTERLHYIGRAMGITFGQEIAKYTNKTNNNEWKQEVLDNNNSRIRFYIFNNPEEHFWIVSLEIYLIQKFKKLIKFNRKVG